MSSHKYELISPERLQETLEIKWCSCFICQKDDKDDPQNPYWQNEVFVCLYRIYSN